MSNNENGLDHIRIPFEKLKFGNKLEVQGYGTIYEGEFDDQKVALKRLNITNLANVKQKLLDEILTISEFRHHPNLVALLGFCDEKINEIILVYEFVRTGNLADKMRTRLNTIQRLEICLGSARGLEYLHLGVDSTKSGIVHGHIKPSKILLNSNNSNNSNNLKYEAKVSSFGLSKIVPGQGTIVSSDDKKKATKESDVYDFGVLLLEVLCGVSELVDTDDYLEKHVAELVPKRLEQDKVRKIVHLDVRKEFKTEALEAYARIACRCVTENVEDRPSMGQVVEELEKALRLQGGEVKNVEIFGSKNTTDGQEEIVVEGNSPNDDDKSVTIDSNEDVNNEKIEEHVNHLIANVNLNVDGEDNGNIVDAISDSTNGEKNAVEDITSEKQSSYVQTQTEKSNIAAENKADNQNITFIQNSQTESSNADLETTEEIIDDSNLNEKSNIVVENEDEPEITHDIISDLNSNEKSNVIDENKDDNQNITQTEEDYITIERETTDCSNLNEKSNVFVENVDNEQKDRRMKLAITSESSNIDANASEQSTNQIEQSSDIPILGGEDGDNVPEITHIEDAKQENDENKIDIAIDMGPKITGEDEIDQESKIIISESNDDSIERGNDKTESESKIIITESNGDSIEKGNDITKSESKRSNSTCSESSNGDICTPSDYLLPKSPADGSTIVKKTSDGSRNCCSCSWWRYISDRVVFYGGQLWNKLCACIRGQSSSKKD